MNRRTFLWGLTFGTLSAPFATAAQQAGKVYRIGWLGTYPPEEQAKARPGSVVNWKAFVQGLREHGWIEKRNFVFERRYSWAEVERYPRLAAAGRGGPSGPAISARVLRARPPLNALRPVTESPDPPAVAASAGSSARAPWRSCG